MRSAAALAHVARAQMFAVVGLVRAPVLTADGALTRLRAILHDAPSARGWEATLDVFEALGEGAEREVALGYAQAHLERWPDALRRLDQRRIGPALARLTAAWARRHRSPYGLELHPALPLARVLELRASLSAEDRAALVQSPHLARLHRLVLSGVRLGQPEVIDLARSPHVARLRALDVSNNYLGGASVRALTGDATRLEGLEELELFNNLVGAEGARALAQSPSVVGFRRLGLGRAQLPHTGLGAIFASQALASLEALDLSHVFFTLAAPFRALARGDGLPSLRALKLASCMLSAEAIATFCDHFQREGLAALCLSGNTLGPGGVLRLTRAPVLASMERLELAHTGCGDAGAEALARATTARSLTHLDLASNGITLRGVKALIASPHLGRLQRLTLKGNPAQRSGAFVLVLSEAVPAEVKLGAVDALTLEDMRLIARHWRIPIGAAWSDSAEALRAGLAQGIRARLSV